MVAGALGGFLTGLFATTEGIAAFADTNPGGAIDGNGRQVWLQVVGALFIFGWNVVWTSLIMLFIRHVCRVPLRMSEEDMLIGDDAVHGEDAYCFDYDVAGPDPPGGPHVIEGRHEHVEAEAGSGSGSGSDGKKIA